MILPLRLSSLTSNASGMHRSEATLFELITLLDWYTSESGSGAGFWELIDLLSEIIGIAKVSFKSGVTSEKNRLARRKSPSLGTMSLWD